LPQGIQITEGSFCSGCTSLQTLTLPQGIQTIGGWFCRYCTSLRHLTLPATLNEVGEYFLTSDHNLITGTYFPLDIGALLNSVGRDCLTSYDYITGTYFPLDIGAFEEIKIADPTLDVIAVNNSGVAEQLRQRRDQLADVAG
jgi:hypothetical protein